MIPDVSDDVATRIQPIGDWILLRRDDPKAMTEGGIALPDTAKQFQKEATVLNLGDASGDAMCIGDRVIFIARDYVPIGDAASNVILIERENIIAILNR